MTHDKPLTFFERPNLTSPYAYPARHRELDADGRPTNRLVESRRRSDLITPVPKAKKRKAAPGAAAQAELDLAAGALGARAGMSGMAEKSEEGVMRLPANEFQQVVVDNRIGTMLRLLADGKLSVVRVEETS